MKLEGLLKGCRQLFKFYLFVGKNFKLLYGVVAITCLVLLLEYVVTSLMIPLASDTTQSSVVESWSRFVDLLGLSPSKSVWLWLFFIFMIARITMGFVQVALANLLARSVHKFLSERVYGRIVSDEPLSEVYRRSVGYYITLGGDDTFRSGTILYTSIQWLVSLVTASVGMVVLFLFSKTIFLALICFLVVCGFIVASIFGIVMVLNHRANGLSRELNTLFVESLNSLRSIRVLGAEAFVRSTYKRQISDYVKLLLEIEVLRSSMRILPAVLLLGAGVFLLWPGSKYSAGFSEASFLAITVILIRIFASLGQLVTNTSMLVTDVRAIRDIDNLVTKPNVSPTSRSIHEEGVDGIFLKDIKYGYSQDNIILNNLSVNFQSGVVYAIIGPSGSGKSTLADIILGFIEPFEGKVSINSARTINQQGNGRLMLVEQQVRIFSTTIRENLLLGISRKNDDLWSVLDLVGLGDHVRSLSDGLDSRLDYQGSNLSGGQRQRLGIARALLHKPDVLILDEATSALDQATRGLVLDNLVKEMKSGILIFITHEAKVAEIADVIIPIGTK